MSDDNKSALEAALDEVKEEFADVEELLSDLAGDVGFELVDHIDGEQLRHARRWRRLLHHVAREVRDQVSGNGEYSVTITFDTERPEGGSISVFRAPSNVDSEG